jgi:hypothetical protein
MSISEARDLLDTAVRELVRGEGVIRDRLRAASVELGQIELSDLPVRYRDRFQYLRSQVEDADRLGPNDAGALAERVWSFLIEVEDAEDEELGNV